MNILNANVTEDTMEDNIITKETQNPYIWPSSALV